MHINQLTNTIVDVRDLSPLLPYSYCISHLHYTASAAVHIMSLFTENTINLGISSHPIAVQTDKQHSPRNVSHACKMYTVIPIQIL